MIIKCFNRKCRDFDLEEVDHCKRPLTMIQECPEADIQKEDKRSLGFYADELSGNECACGKTKKRGQTFCYNCFKSLPKELQSALYKRIGQGYRTAREEAGKYLEVDVW